MKKTVCVLAALAWALPAAAAAGDVLETLGLHRRDVEQSLLTLLARGEVWAPAPKAARSVPASQRASLVRGLCEVAKAWTKTDDFKARYAQERQDTLPKEPAKPRDGAKVAAEEQARVEQSLADAEQAIAALPPDQREAAKQALQAVRQQLSQNGPPADLLDQQEKARYEEEKAEYDKALASALPQDPKEGLRMRLKKLLEATDRVDFKAKLVADGDVQRFAARELEAKPREWKLCFRVGKEACEAARSFAKAWLAELK